MKDETWKPIDAEAREIVDTCIALADTMLTFSKTAKDAELRQWLGHTSQKVKWLSSKVHALATKAASAGG